MMTTFDPPGNGAASFDLTIAVHRAARALASWLQYCGLILLGLPLLATSALAQTAVSGLIFADSHWTVASSPYVITGDVTVTNGAVLTIDPGVTVYMAADANLTVLSGGIQALGTQVSPIRVLSDKTRLGQAAAPGDWRQWAFLSGTVNTQLDYVSFEHGRGLVVQGSAPIFNFLDLRNHQGNAITVDLAASPSGVGNQASGNTLNGIYVPFGDISSAVTWGLRGIPYVIAEGVVSVGSSPAIEAIGIDEVQQGETIDTVLIGTRLSGAQSVDFSVAGISAALQSGATDTNVPIQLTISPSAALGEVSMELLVDAGRATFMGMRIVQALPTVTSLNPSSIYAVQEGTTLTVNGKNFVPDSTITIDGYEVSTAYASASSLSTVLPAQTAGIKSIGVTRPYSTTLPDGCLDGCIFYTYSNTVELTVTVPPLALTPATAIQTLGQPLTLTVAIPFPAPVGGLVVNLSSNATATVSVPASVVIAQGATSATVSVNAIGVGSANVTASSPGFTDSISLLTVNGVNWRRYALIPTLTSATSSSTVGTASASSSLEVAPNNGIAQAFDAVVGPDSWVTTTPSLGEWLKWSFVAAHTVTEFQYGTDNLLDTQLQYSDDGATWFSASLVYQEGQGNFIHPTTTGSTPHRHWRLYVSQVYGATVGSPYGYNQFQLYSDTPLTTTASGWSAPSTPAQATDGSLSTLWNAGGFAPAWIAVDLGVVRPISEVRVYAGAGTPAGLTNYRIQVSSDSITWATVASASSGAYWTNTPVTATGRYVRLQVDSHSGGSWIALLEFQVY